MKTNPGSIRLNFDTDCPFSNVNICNFPVCSILGELTPLEEEISVEATQAYFGQNKLGQSHHLESKVVSKTNCNRPIASPLSLLLLQTTKFVFKPLNETSITLIHHSSLSMLIRCPGVCFPASS